MKLQIFATEEELIVAFAIFIIEKANHYIASEGHFNLVLSGGNSPKKVYQLLASEGYKEKVDWSQVYFFFGDERYVPADDAQYNGLMAEQTLFTPLHISSDQIFKVDTSLAPAKAAEKYLADITRHFKEKPIEFDLIMLGLGDNAHTASLFPHTDVLQEKDATVKEVYLKEENIYRITMSAPLINQARNIAFLVFGDNKAEAVSEVLEGKQNVEQFPAQLIIPKRSLYWFLDKKATELLA